MAQPLRSVHAWFLTAYAVSGAAALIYEVAWTRLLTLTLGHTTAAVSTVLTAFMSGLAGGAVAGGVIASRLTPKRALIVYAGLELVIAAFGVLLPVLLDSSRPLLTWAYADASGPWFGVVRVVVSLGLLLLPTACMGATFPLAVRWLIEERSGTARSTQEADGAAGTGTLYAVNTLGAATGVALAGFMLLPNLGLGKTLQFAAALNVVAGAIALLMLRTAEGPQPATGPKPASPGQIRARRKTAVSRNDQYQLKSPAAVGFVTVGICLSGLSALTFEVAWTRVLAMVLGPTTYAFSTMLMAFIGGIGLGSLLGTRLAAQTKRPVFCLGLAILTASAGGAVATLLLVRAPLVMAAAVSDPTAHFGSVLAVGVGLAVAIMLPATLAFGAAFPLALSAISRWLRVQSHAASAVYAANTLGAIGGALLAGFVFIPFIGLRNTLVVATIVAGITGAAILTASELRGLSRRLMAGATVLPLAALPILPDWNPKLLAAGAYKYAPYVRHPDLESALEAGTLLYYREASAGTVAVRKLAGQVSLSIDGKVDASNGADMLTQKLLAHLPLLLHPRPERVAIVGLGSGVTLGSALRHPIKRADTFEISPQVVEASSHFAHENQRALSDPRSRLIVGDGRTHLMLARETYDVIISEPSNPWMAGVASLFTREFFESVRRRLTPGGVMCQWAHAYDITEEELHSIVSTFVTVFPDSTLWLVGSGDLLLIGTADRPVMSESLGLQNFRQRLLPAIEQDLSAVGANRPFTFLSLFVAGGADLRDYARGARIQTDDDPWIEFSGPRSIFGKSPRDNAVRLRAQFQTSAVPRLIEDVRNAARAAEYRDRGLMLLQAGAADLAFGDFVEALKQKPDDPVVLDGLVRSASEDRADAAVTLLRGQLERHSRTVPLRLTLARLLAAQGRQDEAIAILDDGLRVVEDPIRLQEQLASVYADQGNVEALTSIAIKLVRHDNPGADAIYYLATSHYLKGEYDAALKLAREAIQKNPAHSRALNLLALTNVALDRPDDARSALLASIRADPRDPTSYTNLGLLELQRLKPEAASQWFAEALTIDPRWPAALNGLADALERQGHRDRAERLRAVRRAQGVERQ